MLCCFELELLTTYDELTKSMNGEDFKVNAKEISKHHLHSGYLDYLCLAEEEQQAATNLAMNHYKSPHCVPVPRWTVKMAVRSQEMRQWEPFMIVKGDSLATLWLKEAVFRHHGKLERM